MDSLTAVITGGTRGIGRAVAEAFAGEGAAVTIGARDADAVVTTVSALESIADSGPIAGVRTDVRDELDVERLAETASRTGPSGIDIVVPAAGVYHGPPGETPTDEDSYTAFDDHWRTNGRGVFATIRESLPHLADDARVLVPTGAVARTPKPGYGSYAVSKATTEAIARGFAVDTDYTVGCLDPGQVATDLSGGQGRDPESIADMFVWAATDVDRDALDGEVVGLKEWKMATR